MATPIDPVTSPAPAVPRWRRAIRVLYLILVVAALVVAVIARRQELADQLSAMELAPLLWSVGAALAGVGVSGLIWRRMLTGLGSALPFAVAARVFFVAQLGKYLPGSLWPVLAQAEMGRDHGVPKRSAVAAQTLFMWIHLITGGILGVPVLAVLGVIPLWLAGAPVVLIPLLFPGPLAGVMNWLLRRAGRAPLPNVPSGLDMAVACGWATLMWALYGLHVYFAVDALEFPAPGVGPLLVAIGAFAAAWSAGFLFLIAPAGAGARELVLVAGLSVIAASETAFAVALVSRLVLTVADGIWGGAGLLTGAKRGGGRGSPGGSRRSGRFGPDRGLNAP